MDNKFEKVIELLDKSTFYYIITANMLGRYSYINKLYSDSFKGIHGEILDQPYQITMHPDDTLVCEQVSKKCFENPGKLFPATIRKHDGKGGFVVTQWEYQAMFHLDGSPEGIFCLGYNITKFIEERNQLDLFQIEMEETQSLLDKKERVLKQIIFHQSHIIRQPVVNILGLIGILKQMEVDQNLTNIIDMLWESTNQLDNVIRDIVDKAYE